MQVPGDEEPGVWWVASRNSACATKRLLAFGIEYSSGCRLGDLAAVGRGNLSLCEYPEPVFQREALRRCLRFKRRHLPGG